jgi:hypothetical protein
MEKELTIDDIKKILTQIFDRYAVAPSVRSTFTIEPPNSNSTRYNNVVCLIRKPSIAKPCEIYKNLSKAAFVEKIME